MQEKISHPSPPVASAGRVITVCLLIAAVEGYDLQAFGICAPHIVQALGLAASQQGWAAGAAMIGLMLGAFAGGWLSDRMGRKPVLLAAVIGFGLCSAWTAFTQGYPDLLLARFATGIGFGAALPNLIAIAAEISSPGRRGVTLSMIFCGLPAGGAVVAGLAKLIAGRADWRWIFLAGCALALAAVPWIFTAIPETRPPATQIQTSTLRHTLFGSGQRVPTALYWMASALTVLLLNVMLNWLPSLVVAKGLSAGDGAVAALAFNTAGILGALLLGWLADRLGFRWSMLLTYGALSGVVAALGMANGLHWVVVLSGAAGFLILGAQFALYGLAALIYSAEARGVGAGAAVAVARLGAIVGPVIVGEMRQSGSAAHVLALFVPVVIAAGLMVFLLTLLLERRLEPMLPIVAPPLR